MEKQKDLFVGLKLESANVYEFQKENYREKRKENQEAIDEAKYLKM